MSETDKPITVEVVHDKVTRHVTVNVTLNPAPPPSPTEPIWPVPDRFPTIWRVAHQFDDDELRWYYVRRGLNEPFAEFALCEQHKICLEACPPDEAEIKRIDDVMRLQDQ